MSFLIALWPLDSIFKLEFPLPKNVDQFFFLAAMKFTSKLEVYDSYNYQVANMPEVK